LAMSVKRVLQQSKFFVCGFSAPSTYRFEVVIFNPTQHRMSNMSNTALQDIQRALKIIQANVDKSNYDAKLAALELVIDSSKDVVNQIRKARAPDVKKKTVVVPKEKKVKRIFPQSQQQKPSLPEPKSTEPVKPSAPLQNKRSD